MIIKYLVRLYFQVPTHIYKLHKKGSAEILPHNVPVYLLENTDEGQPTWKGR